MVLDAHYVRSKPVLETPPGLRRPIVGYVSVPHQSEIDASVFLWESLWFPVESIRTIADDNPISLRFQEQAEKWEKETGHLSSPNRRMAHPSYQAILGMGKEVVPLLLEDLRKNQRPWFGALSYLTQANPINSEDAGNMEKMIAAWEQWGKANGIL